MQAIASGIQEGGSASTLARQLSDESGWERKEIYRRITRHRR
jgi:hypothetical protein